jgi:hypothetical protein
MPYVGPYDQIGEFNFTIAIRRCVQKLLARDFNRKFVQIVHRQTYDVCVSDDVFTIPI